MLSVETRKIQ